MADTGYSSGSKDGENDSPTKSEEKRAFKDPLISGLDITDDADVCYFSGFTIFIKHNLC